jgi:MarR family transcriptional regulator for hemolysin
MRQDFDRRIADVGVTRSQWSMIVAVARHPGSTQRQIAELLEMSEASAGRLIDRLCADGLLERQERNDDRRARSVFVTDKVKPMLERLGEIARASEGRVFRNMSDEELEQLSTLLDKVYRNLA